MKKTYKAPSCEIIEIQGADIIATSFGTNDEVGNRSVLGRGDWDWDDEE